MHHHSGYDLVLAVMLLTTPPGTPEPAPDPAQWAGLQEAIHKTAIGWEILDPRETRYVFARVEDFEVDLNLLRRRYVELKDAPLTEDCVRFPDRRTVNDLVRFNRAYNKYLQNRMVMESDRAHIIKEALDENEQLYKVWDYARDARCEFYYITVRRQALKNLRDVLGEENYAEAKMPPHVPVWYLVEIP